MKTLRTLALSLAVTLGIAATAQAVAIPVFSDIVVATTWTAGNAYWVQEPITVRAPLTIEPGVTVFVSAGFPINVENPGSIIAQGTPEAHIYFKPYGDPWGGLRFTNSLDNMLTWVDIEHATAPGEVIDPLYLNRGGGVRIADSYVQFDHVTITQCNASAYGGGVYIAGFNSNVSFTNSRIMLNSAGANGGGLYVAEGPSVSLTRTLIHDNYATGGLGGGLYATGTGWVNLTNCTIARNNDVSDYTSGGLYVKMGTNVMLKNTIVYANTGTIVNASDPNTNLTVSYSDIEGTIWPGDGNVNENPWWANPAGGNFDLTAGSPLIDQGDPQSPYDPDGTITDIGATYFPHEPPPPVQQYLQLPTATVPAGTSGEFPITGTVVGGENGTGVDIAFAIDPAAIASVSLVSTPFPSKELNRVDNTIYLGLASEASLSITDGVIATLSFTAQPTAVRSGTGLMFVPMETHVNDQPVTLIDGMFNVPDNPPVWTVEPQNAGVLENASLEFAIHAQDQDNDPITYTMSGLPEPGPQGPNLDLVTGAFSWTPTYDQAGVYTVTFTASTMPGQPHKPAWSGVDVSIQKTVTITVTNVDRAPYWTAAPPENAYVNEGETLSFSIAASDPDPEDVPGIVYSGIGIPASATLNPQTGEFSWTPTYTMAGQFGVIFTATSGPAPGRQVSGQSFINVINVNRAPEWTQTGPQTVNEGGTLSFVVSASDADGQALNYAAYDVPYNANFNPGTRQFTFSPDFTQSGDYMVTFRVTDGEAWVDMQVPITVNNVNRAPEWDATADQEIAEGSLLSVPVSAHDPDGDQLEVTMVANPSGATLDGLWFQWTPGYDAAPGVYEVTLRAWDGAAEAFDTFLITVTNTNRPPEWSPVQPQAVAEGQLLAFQVSATDADGQTLTYSATDLPSGATFDAPSRTFSWTPTILQSGFYSVTFNVFDGEATVSQPVQIDVVNTPSLPVWGTMPTVAPVGAGLPVTFTVSATDPFSEGVFYGLGESPGSIDPTTGVFTWTPWYNEEGPITIEVSATNRDGTSWANVTVNVYSRYGDATETDGITAADAAAVLQYSVKLPVEINMILADVTGNEMVTAYDAALILHKLIINPDFRFPVQNQQALSPKLVSGLPASLVWERVNGGWALRATNTFGLMAGEFTLSLPGGAPVNVTGGDMVAFRQDGENLFVSVIGSSFADGTLFILQTDGGQPGILSASLNEGAIPVAAAAPSAFALEQNAPNPFNPSTTIRFALPEASHVNLVVYDVNGRAIRTLASGSFSAGMHSVVWDARDDGGREVASGTYLYRIVTDKGTFVKRMTLLK